MTGVFKTGNIIPLPGMDGNRHFFKLHHRGVDIHLMLRVNLTRQFITFLNSGHFSILYR